MTDRVILICTIIIAAVYLYATTLIPSLEIGDPLGPKAFPRLLGIGLLLAAGMLGLEMLTARKTQASAPAESSRFDLYVIRVLACVAVWTGCYYMAFQGAGYIVATAVYLLGLMAWFNRGKWLANVLTVVLFAMLSYLMFVKLDVNLPRGVEIFSWISDTVLAAANAVIGAFKAIFQFGGSK